MNINKNNIKLEVLNNDTYSEKFHTDPLFNKTINTLIHDNSNVQESELLQIIFELCSVVDKYRNEYAKCLENQASTMPITKEEKEALRFFKNHSESR